MFLQYRRVLALILVSLLPAASAVAATTLVHTQKSAFENIVVFESDGERCMNFGSINAPGRQTCVSLAHPNTLLFEYTQMMMGALYLKPDARRILIIGLGGGSLPKALSQVLPDARIDTVEIDPAVVSVARRYFGFKTSPLVQVHVQEGRAFVERAAAKGAKYDIVMLDAFDENYIPKQLLTRQFMREVRSILVPDGVLAANTFSSSTLYNDESATYADTFGTFYNLRSSNRVILAKMDGLPSPGQLRERAEAFGPRFGVLGFDALSLLPRFSTRRDWPDDSRVLTD